MTLQNRLSVLTLALLCLQTSSFSSWNYRRTTFTGTSPLDRQTSTRLSRTSVLLPFPTIALNTLSFPPSPPSPSSRLNLDSNDGENSDAASTTVLADSDQLLLGVASTTAGVITLYSEYVLKSTGCGLPAGPFGLVGAAEGVSYLGIVGVGAFSLYQKYRTGSGLPPGPGGILGLGEGLSFLAILAGIIVFILQITNFGYIPNAIPMEGGMCS